MIIVEKYFICAKNQISQWIFWNSEIIIFHKIYKLIICLGSHVTVDAGTGLVHTAPGHGQEDYLLGLEHQLDLSCPVDENGCYDSTVICSELIGLDVLGSGNEKIMELLVSIHL